MGLHFVLHHIAKALPHRFAIFLCSLDVEILSSQIAKGQFKDDLIGQQTTQAYEKVALVPIVNVPGSPTTT